MYMTTQIHAHVCTLCMYMSHVLCIFLYNWRVRNYVCMCDSFTDYFEL